MHEGCEPHEGKPLNINPNLEQPQCAKWVQIDLIFVFHDEVTFPGMVTIAHISPPLLFIKASASQIQVSHRSLHLTNSCAHVQVRAAELEALAGLSDEPETKRLKAIAPLNAYLEQLDQAEDPMAIEEAGQRFTEALVMAFKLTSGIMSCAQDLRWA